MMNQQINDWKIIGIRPNKRKGYVLAQCVCGKIKELTGRSIRAQTSKNCGCRKGEKLRRRQRIVGTDSAIQTLFSRYFRTARRFGRQFLLSKEEFIRLTSANCFYCEATPASRSQRHSYIYYYNGIDRVDNTKGYEADNVVTCCTQCNTKKGSITLGMVEKTLEFLKRGKS